VRLESPRKIEKGRGWLALIVSVFAILIAIPALLAPTEV